MVFELKKIINFDSESLESRKNQEYFRTRIAQIGDTYSPDQIRVHIEEFYTKELYRSQEGFLFFLQKHS